MTVLVSILQTLVIFVFLVVALSRLGRPNLAALTVNGYLVVALLGSAVETALYDASSSLMPGLASALTLMVADRLSATLLVRSPRFRRWLIGRPIVLLKDGEILTSNLRKARLSPNAVAMAARQRGYENLTSLRFAVLETNGTIAIVPKKAP